MVKTVSCFLKNWREVLNRIRTLIIQDPEKFYLPERFLQL